MYFAASPQTAIEIQYNQQESGTAFELPEINTENYISAQFLLSDNDLAPALGPQLISATWLPTVQRRISESVPSGMMMDAEDNGDNGYITLEIASQAVAFFKATSDVLPDSEPYIYASTTGDLIAEFQVQRGKLTTIIARDSVIAFAVAGNNAMQATINFPFGNLVNVRRELSIIMNTLRNGEHGLEA